MENMIKAIIFDYGGVLTKEVFFYKFAKIHASRFGVEQKEFNELIKENWSKAKTNKISSKTFWLNLSKFLKVDSKVLRKDIINFFGFRYEILDLIRKLKEKYKIGLLTNQIEDWLEGVIEKHKLNEVFDIIITSYRTKKAKPDIAIFQEAIEGLRVKPDECIFIDDLENNTLAASRLGMKVILFKNTKQLISDLKRMGIKI